MCIIPSPETFVNTFFAFLVTFNKNFVFLVNNPNPSIKNMGNYYKKIGILEKIVKKEKNETALV